MSVTDEGLIVAKLTLIFVRSIYMSLAALLTLGVVIELNFICFQALDQSPEILDSITLEDFMHAYALGEQFMQK